MVVAAIITPADVLSMMAAALFLLVLYEISIFMSRLMEKKNEKKKESKKKPQKPIFLK